MKSNHLLRAICLLILTISFFPVSNAGALVTTTPPPVDMFQLPWDQGIAWVAIDGIDNGSKRPASSSHNYKLGGAIDFAPKVTMITGEDTSKFWVTAAADGTVVETSTCYVTIAHAGGWITQYQFLGKIQVKLGDVVARNQRLGIIADGVRQRYCPGFQDINVPHLHFMLRPSIVGATLAGWEVKYNSLFNRTTFNKGLISVGLYKPLLNVMDSPATPTPTVQPSVTPSSTPSTTPVVSPTPTLSGPYVSTTIDPQSIDVGDTTLVTVRLNNVPVEGYTSAEFTCSYNAGLFEVSNIQFASLFGADAATAVNGPGMQSFIAAIAGSNGDKAITSGTVFTFQVKGLQTGQTVIECRARVSQGNNVLNEIPFVVDYLTIAGGTPTPSLTVTVTESSTSPTPTDSSGEPSSTPSATLTPGGPSDTPSPTITPGGSSATPQADVAFDFVANACSAVWTSGAGQLPCPGVDGDAKGFVLKLSNPKLETGVTDTRAGLLTAPQNVQNGYIQGLYPPFHVQSGDRFRATISCEYGAVNCYTAYRLDYQVGNEAVKTLWGAFLERYEGLTYSVDIDLTSLAGKDVKFILTSLAAGSASGDRPLWVAPIISRAGTTPTATATPPADWLSFINTVYGFQFSYPPQSQVLSVNNTYARINLPFVHGTNLAEKYLEVIVAENPTTCRSPLATSSILETTETVTINGLTFLKETGGDASAGHFHKWVAYSTSRNNICVSLDFVLNAANPGSFATPPPLYDEAAESAVFGQIVSTYAWFALPTATSDGLPTATFTPTPSLVTPTATFTSTPGSSPTPSGGNAVVTGQVIASKPLTLNLYDAAMSLVTTIESLDGTFNLNVAPGTYTIVATAQGYLSAQRTITLNSGITNTLPTIPLVAGDLDNNQVIDQFDALTIGMSYNSSAPAAADLNNDGIINVLDLELLAQNYRKTGPVSW